MQLSIGGVTAGTGSLDGVALVDEDGNWLGGAANPVHVNTEVITQVVVTIAALENTYDSPAPVAAFSTLTTIATIAVANRSQINFELLVGVHALTAFEVHARTNPAGNYVKVASVAADFTTPKFPILGATASPVTLAVGEGMFSMNTKGFDSIILKANGLLSTCTVFDGGQ